jgi:hypothetical protein
MAGKQARPKVKHGGQARPKVKHGGQARPKVKHGGQARPKVKHGGQARNGGLPKRYAQAKTHLVRRFAAHLDQPRERSYLETL